MPLILALERQRQVDLCEIKANLVYIVSARPARDTGRPCLKKKITTIYVKRQGLEDQGYPKTT